MAFRAMVGLQQDDLVMVFSGGEWKRKGLDLAIRALQHILDRRVKLLVMGIDKAQGEFQNLARVCGVTGRVVFAGFRSDVEAGLAASDLFLFPSWYEAFSVAMIEAAACGLPIVATRINGAEDFVKDEENGTFITNVPEEIARVVSSLVSNPDRLKEMGAAARATVVERFTWDRVARETEQAYFELLANRAGGTEQVTS